MEKYKILTVLLTVVSSLLLIKLLMNDSESPPTQFIIERDTVIVNQREVIKVDKIVPKIIIKKDTIIETKPFIATIDTIIKRDTVFLRFEYPENLFSMKLSPAADSIKIEKIYEYKEKEITWLDRVTMFAAGFGVAFLISK